MKELPAARDSSDASLKCLEPDRAIAIVKLVLVATIVTTVVSY
jgi:hypothetical protein